MNTTCPCARNEVSRMLRQATMMCGWLAKEESSMLGWQSPISQCFQNQARPGWRSISWTPRISDGRLLSASEESIKSFRTCEKPQVGRKTDMVEVAENGDGFHETFETAEFL